MEKLIDKILQWGNDKFIIGPNGKGTKRAQANKMLEECNETRDAVLIGIYEINRDGYISKETQAEIKDGIGDLFVTAILLANMHNLTSEECLQTAYEVISERSGVMVNGSFVKDK